MKIVLNRIRVCETCKEIIMPGMNFQGRDTLEDDGQITEHYYHLGACPKFQPPFPDYGQGLGGVSSPWTIAPGTITTYPTNTPWYTATSSTNLSGVSSLYNRNLTATALQQVQAAANQQMANALSNVWLVPNTSSYQASPSYSQTEEDNDSWIRKGVFKILDLIFKRKETNEKDEANPTQNY